MIIKGKTIDRYTIFLKHGAGFYSAGGDSNYGHHGLLTEGIDFGGSDGDAEHTTDKEEIKRINKFNKHLGQYLTINAMKRLNKNLLNLIQQEVKENQLINRHEGDYLEYETADFNGTFFDYAKEQGWNEYSNKDNLDILKLYTNLFLNNT